jgi:FtsP/CotA-like multicopper oxidase with cupredoxin domain
VPRVAAVALALVGCAASSNEPAIESEWSALVPAVDLDPDPDVVEIELVAEVASVELVPGIVTEVWAYRDAGNPEAEASVPGPLVEAELGDRFVVHLRNELPQGTTVHWHGLRLPDAMDGNPMVSGSIATGESATAEFVLRDDGLHWYHPHVYADEQIQRGLQGAVVVHGPDEPDADVERVLVLDDVMLDDDGAIVLEPTDDDLMLGRRGNVLLVNGRTPTVATAGAGTVERWRLVNTSNGRFFALAFAGSSFTVVGWDGGPVADPYETDELVIAPGERYDVLVSIAGEVGDHLLLETTPFARGGGVEDPGPFTLLELQLDAPPADGAATIDPPQRTIAPIEVDDSTPGSAGH